MSNQIDFVVRKGICMLYINEKDMAKVKYWWEDTINVIESAIKHISAGDYSQPLKPYLRFGNLSNRIIAMPAYVGGEINSAGIKWISSFPENIDNNMPRASCVTVLNDTLTGVPLAIFNTPLISIIRTASVSGYLLKKYLEHKKKANFNIGIVGWGPIGQNHYAMCKEILRNSLEEIYVFDIRDIVEDDNRITICKSWQEVYEKSDIFMTCTSTLERYINLPTHEDKLVMDISLRDFKAEALDSYSKPFITDDWYEVNREDTDIEYYAKMGKLESRNVISVCDLDKNSLSAFYTDRDSVFFAPMGMGVFDIAIANFFYQQALNTGIGTHI